MTVMPKKKKKKKRYKRDENENVHTINNYQRIISLNI